MNTRTIDKRKEERDKVVMFDSDEAATLQTVTGWVSRFGTFHGDDERAARYYGCTHRACVCGKSAERAYIKCKECRDKQSDDHYNARTFLEWDKKEPVYSERYDRYFFSEDDLIDFIIEEKIDPIELQLMLCEANEYTEIQEDNWVDILPEDGALPKELKVALNSLNAVIRSLAPASYLPGQFRTSYTLNTLKNGPDGRTSKSR